MPTVASAVVRIEPVALAPAIRVDSWSPDGNWLAYWLSVELPQSFYPFPPGKLHFLNIRTGLACSHSEYVARSHGDRLVWPSDGQVQIILASDKLAFRGTPCKGDFVKIPYRPEVKETDSILSPKGGYRARSTSRTESDGTLNAITTITRVATGRAETIIKWRHRGGEGELGPGGQWLIEGAFLIYETLDQGPLLITVGKGTVRVAPELFRAPAVIGEREGDLVFLRAVGAAVNGADAYHIAMHGVGTEAAFPPVRLYHSETGKVEELGFRYLWTPAFSPDGRWLLLDERPVSGGYESYALWVRAVDPDTGGAQILASSSIAQGSPYTLWAPDWRKVALGFPGHVSVYTFPDGVPVGSWETKPFDTVPRLWSPDNKFVAVEGNVPGEWQQALFVIQP
jgi:hypothetical protein